MVKGSAYLDLPALTWRRISFDIEKFHTFYTSIYVFKHLPFFEKKVNILSHCFSHDQLHKPNSTQLGITSFLKQCTSMTWSIDTQGFYAMCI